jgi:iron(III) transport system ATP-binding protein
MLELNSVNKSFDDKQILFDIDCKINDGEIVVLLGNSGSGKSTLLNLIAGFEESDNGVITYDNTIMEDSNQFVEPQKRNIGFVFQNYALFPHLNVAKNIEFGIEDLEKEQREKKVLEVLDIVNMLEHKSKYPHELSGGQQQRIAIARVLARDSKLILFDEPFASIDSNLKLKILAMIKSIVKQYNKTAVFVTHCPKEAILLADKIGYIENGRLIQYDCVKNILDKPANENIEALFSQKNFLFQKIEDLVKLA